MPPLYVPRLLESVPSDQLPDSLWVFDMDVVPAAGNDLDNRMKWRHLIARDHVIVLAGCEDDLAASRPEQRLHRRRADGRAALIPCDEPFIAVVHDAAVNGRRGFIDEAL